MSNIKLKIPPVALTLIAAFLIWLCNRYIPLYRLDFAVQQPVAFLIGLCGLIIALIAVAAFIKNKTTVDPRSPGKADTLVITGFYRYSRNPMYAGLLLMLVGLALYGGAVSGFGVVILFVGYMNRFQIILEEFALQQKFGDRFTEYRDIVRRWI